MTLEREAARTLSQPTTNPTLLEGTMPLSIFANLSRSKFTGLALRRALWITRVAPLIAVSTPGHAGSSQPITAANWVLHPRIVEIRSVFQEVQALGRARGLSIKERDCENDVQGFEVFAKLYTDSKNIVRRYELTYRTSDHGNVETSYYDKNGDLRFIYANRAAASGGALEERHYFDTNGNLIWRHDEETGGGYTFAEGPVVAPDPGRAFQRVCEAIR
jgi:hypothetical protein